MNIPVKMGIKGEVTLTLTDVRNGKKTEVRQDNLLLDSFLNRWFTQSTTIFPSAMSRCYIGTGDSPPSAADLGLQGSQLAMVADSNVVETRSIESFATRIHSDGSYSWDVCGGYNNSVFVGFRNYATSGNTLKVFTISPDGELIEKYSVAMPIMTDTSLTAYRKRINSVGNYFAFASNGGVGVISLGDNDVELFFSANTSSTVRALEWLSDDTTLLVSLQGGGLYKYDLTLSSPARVEILGTSHKITSLRINRSGSKLVCGEDNVLHLYNVSENGDITKYADVTLVGTTPRNIVFMQDDRHFITLNSDGSFSIYDVNDGTKVNNTGIFESFVSDTLVDFDCDEVDNVYVISNYPPFYVRFFKRRGDFSYDHYGSIKTTGSDGRSACNGIVVSSYGKAVVGSGAYGQNATYGSLTLYDFVPAHNLAIASQTRTWVFPAGVGTGVVRELALLSNSTNIWTSRVVLEQPINKTDFHQLDVTWCISVESPRNVATGTIVNGQRDGETDINWSFDLNEKNLYELCFLTTVKNRWFGISGTPTLSVGNNNVTNRGLLFDPLIATPTPIERFVTQNIRIVEPYIPNSLQRKIRLFLEVDQGNIEPIGELEMEGLGRITFDPPLDKVDTHRLYVDVIFGFERG